ncbi:MAG: alpha-E domain-containing protein [Gammaproteobacteria bacterium]|nr:alpha-E domain-containing protein [Gammaproteobacteria bacterium]
MGAPNNARGGPPAPPPHLWAALTPPWVSYRALSPTDVRGARLPEVLDTIRQRAMLFRGAMLGTTLRSDGYYFCQLGAFIERADQTARILDVKYYILLPRSELVGGDIDTYQWETILRSVSANRAYRHVYREGFTPRNVAEFLILRPEMPRSLRFTYRWILESLTGLAHHYGTAAPSLSEARAMHDRLEQGDLDRIFRDGLHEFLLDFLARNNDLASSIARDYNFA